MQSSVSQIVLASTQSSPWLDAAVTAEVNSYCWYHDSNITLAHHTREQESNSNRLAIQVEHIEAQSSVYNRMTHLFGCLRVTSAVTCTTAYNLPTVSAAHQHTLYSACVLRMLFPKPI
eukprot:9554-Heterococcus_DN1.PRE.8